jgi:hypothetical protein
MMNDVTGFPPRDRALMSGLVPGLILIAIIMLGVVKLVPVYVDHNFLVSTTRSLLESRNAGTLSQTEVRNEIAQSLRINNIRAVSSTAVVLVRSGSSPAARISYERRVPLMYNIELAIQFDETVE